MEHKEAAEILRKLIERHSLNNEEKEAVATAIGILGWMALSKNKVKTRNVQKKKSTEW